MDYAETEPDQIDQESLVREISDESLEATFGTRVGAATTLINAGSYCFTCRPQDWTDR
jgi:hypothetical protein